MSGCFFLNRVYSCLSYKVHSTQLWTVIQHKGMIREEWSIINADCHVTHQKQGDNIVTKQVLLQYCKEQGRVQQIAIQNYTITRHSSTKDPDKEQNEIRSVIKSKTSTWSIKKSPWTWHGSPKCVYLNMSSRIQQTLRLGCLLFESVSACMMTGTSPVDWWLTSNRHSLSAQSDTSSPLSTTANNIHTFIHQMDLQQLWTQAFCGSKTKTATAFQLTWNKIRPKYK